jgi:hypothetical protein
MSENLNVLHLLTADQGALRLITLTKTLGNMPLRGAVLTQSEPVFYPAIASIMLVKIPQFDSAKHRAMVGPIDASAEEYAEMRTELEETERSVVKLALGAPHQVPVTDGMRVTVSAPQAETSRITPH